MRPGFPHRRPRPEAPSSPSPPARSSPRRDRDPVGGAPWDRLHPQPDPAVPLALSLLLTALSGPTAGAADTIQIPAGSFVMGSGRSPDEPQREVSLAAYRIDRTEVTVTAFEAFAAEGYADPSLWSAAGQAWLTAHPKGAGATHRAAGRSGDHPVVAVTWYEAEAYCRWKGGALPTEAQWEHAACGQGGQRYPWGDSIDVDAVWYQGGKTGHIQEVHTAAVDTQAEELRSPCGALHMIGNAWEWTADGYHRDINAFAEGGVAAGTTPTWRTVRGGSFMNLPSYATCTHREPAEPDRYTYTIGFRCVYPATEG